MCAIMSEMLPIGPGAGTEIGPEKLRLFFCSDRVRGLYGNEGRSEAAAQKRNEDEWQTLRWTFIIRGTPQGEKEFVLLYYVDGSKSF